VAYVVKRTRKSGGLSYLVRYHGPDGKTHSRQFPKKVDADRFANASEVAKHSGSWIDPGRGRILFSEWVEKWKPSQVHLRPSSRARDESYLDTHIVPRFGNVPLSKIQNADIRAWIAELSALGLAPATVGKAKQIVSKILQAAVDDRRIPTNPADRIPLPRIEREEMRYLDPAQVSHLADTIDQRYRALVLLGAYGGLRLGEMFGLRWGRVDLLRRRVQVAEVCVEVKGELTFGPPKTRAGIRTVPIPTVVVDDLAALTAPNPDPQSLVFTSPQGAPLRAGQFRQRTWYPAIKEADLEGLRLHDLRHTAVALWIAAGGNPKEIAVRAGHASVVTVLDRYGHLYPEAEDRLSDALDAMAGAVTPTSEIAPRSTRPRRPRDTAGTGQS
jgi:integrase